MGVGWEEGGVTSGMRWGTGVGSYTLPDDIENKALTGFRNIIPTIIIGNNEMVFPAIYIINNVIGICFSGPIAISHDFLKTLQKVG